MSKQGRHLKGAPAERRLHRCPDVPSDGLNEEYVHHYQHDGIDSATVRTLLGQLGPDDQRQKVGEEADEASLECG